MSAIIRHQITIVDTGEHYFCSESQHLLKGMTSLGKTGIPSGCHGGGCGVCKVQIMQGKTKTLSMSGEHVSSLEAANGIGLACRIFPKSDVSLKVVGKLSKRVAEPGKKRKYGFV